MSPPGSRVWENIETGSQRRSLSKGASGKIPEAPRYSFSAASGAAQLDPLFAHVQRHDVRGTIFFPTSEDFRDFVALVPERAARIEQIPATARTVHGDEPPGCFRRRQGSRLKLTHYPADLRGGGWTGISPIRPQRDRSRAVNLRQAMRERHFADPS